MTEEQALLLTYVDTKARKIIGRKESSGIEPAIATDKEILADIFEDTVACMRFLHHMGELKGVRTLNSPALMKKK